LQERVLEVSERSLGQEHPDTLTAMANLGCTYRRLGAISTSIEFLETALDKANRIFGHEHPEALWMTVQLALSYQIDRRLVDALRLLESTFETRKRILGGEHPKTKGTAAILERAYQELLTGRYVSITSSLNPSRDGGRRFRGLGRRAALRSWRSHCLCEVFLSSYINIGVILIMDRYSSTCLPSDYLEQVEIPIVNAPEEVWCISRLQHLFLFDETLWDEALRRRPPWLLFSVGRIDAS